MQRALRELDFGTQRYAPFVVFINGEYYGILNARDRFDRRYLVERFGLPTDDVDLLENNKEVEEGDAAAWSELLQFVELNKGKADFLAGVERRVSLESFIDYHAAQIFIGNSDWPGNNIAYWRYRTEDNPPRSDGEEESNSFADGRWRWLMYDTDFTCRKGPEFNAIEAATEAGRERWPNPDWSTFLLRTLLTDSDFRDRFITRFSDLLNTTFLPANMEAAIRELERGIADEMPKHIHRWNEPIRTSHWHAHVDELVECFEARPQHQWEHLQRFFDLGETYRMTVESPLR